MDKELFSVRDKVCLVTGASSGIGGHLSRLLLSNGAIVFGLDSKPPEWDGTFADTRFSHAQGDVRDEHQVLDLIERITDKYGAPDVVINNAGISQIEKSLNVSSDGFSDLLQVNVVAAGRIAGLAAAQMKAASKPGSIINITSVMAGSSMAGLSAYSASKAALAHLTRGMAAEWARYGIRVNNLAPGWFPSGMTDQYVEKGLDKVLKARIPMNRLGEYSELDGACLLLASDASHYITGSTIVVDGGFSLIN